MCNKNRLVYRRQIIAQIFKMSLKVYPYQGRRKRGKRQAIASLPFNIFKTRLHREQIFFRPTILQLNIEGLTASKMNVLHHLAMQSEALVILLQETHCTDAEKLVLPNYQLAGSSLSRKLGLATFVHVPELMLHAGAALKS